MSSNSLFRTKFVSFFILAFALILIGKLFLVQIVHKNSYSEKADRQYATPSSNIFERGTIYFTQKDGQLVSAAAQTMGFKVAIDTSKIGEPEELYNQLSENITLDHDTFIAQAKKVNDPYEEIINHLTKEQADAISAKNLAGVSIFKEKWRFYPGNNLASHTLGFVGFKGDELAGRYGLEREYNNVLSRDKDNPYVNFFAEVFSNINKTFFKGEEKSGNIVTTIEPTVQGFLEKTLSSVRSKYQVDSIGGIIMNPQDGSIYAMAASPDFNPNDFSDIKNTSVFTNPFVENVFEFGSVVKPLVMAAGIDAGVVNANTKYYDYGFVTVEKKQIYNFDKKGRGANTSMQDVLNQSLNTGMVYVYQHLGKQNMRDYMLAYGIKDKTGIDLPNETSGLVSNLNSPREIEYANASFGQGIALTPIEITRALASLGNGGNLVVPHIVKKIKYNDGTEKEFTYQTTPTKITKQTSEEISRMLVTVMDKSLKSGTAKMEHHSIAVKTGTAQVAKENGGGYYEDRHTHSFFGYFPAYNPKFIVFLYAVNPKGVPYASQTWADPFLDISKFLLNYYEVPPDR
ncbi:MAG TPA: penicillin-binding protein 2 [Candidatus Paceibacterota bacterium]|nr:penicillin-binding protein 2 [Candidatus Paceibacterota bacterium]